MRERHGQLRRTWEYNEKKAGEKGHKSPQDFLQQFFLNRFCLYELSDGYKLIKADGGGGGGGGGLWKDFVLHITAK